MDARKLIEREMERFKICGKETKTNAFSKEGLGQQPKTDPKEKAKSETRDWLNNVVGELENQIDSFEAEIDGLSVKKGKTRPPRLEDFDEFSDVDELYSSFPLEKVESLEDLVTMGPPGLVKGVSACNAVLSMENHLAVPAAQAPVLLPKSKLRKQRPRTTPTLLQRHPPPKRSPVGSAPPTPVGSRSTPVIVKATSDFVGASTASSGHLATSSLSGLLDNAGVFVPSSPLSIPNSVKEEDIRSFPGCKASPALSEVGLRGSEMAKRNILGAEERLGSGGMMQLLVSPLGNRMILQQAAKTGEGIGSAVAGSVGESSSMAGRVFSSAVPELVGVSVKADFDGKTSTGPDQMIEIARSLIPFRDLYSWDQRISLSLYAMLEESFGLARNEGKLEELSPPATYVVVGLIKLANLR
ncbi:hypothetical protein ACH5RR_040565 [Cinchona calisaya]|uniref:CCR4-Not complex component Not N-terminal domain-containing protein n=1 Tax=Cinchona calisaya TaxID=153742 RepID=A0ABD2XSK4_9GENT